MRMSTISSKEKHNLLATCWNTCEPAGSWLGFPTSQWWTTEAHWNHTAPEKSKFPAVQKRIPTLKPFMGTLEVPVTNWSSRDLISLLKDKTTRQYLKLVRFYQHYWSDWIEWTQTKQLPVLESGGMWTEWNVFTSLTLKFDLGSLKDWCVSIDCWETHHWMTIWFGW